MVGHAAIFALENVCYWHKADMPVAVMDLRLGESNKTASGYSNLVRNFRSNHPIPINPDNATSKDWVILLEAGNDRWSVA